MKTITCNTLDEVVDAVKNNKPCKVIKSDDPANLEFGWTLKDKDIRIAYATNNLKNDPKRTKVLFNTEASREVFLKLLKKAGK